MNQLAISLGVTAGDYTALLNTQASVTTFIKAAADVLSANGGTAAVTTALGTLQLAATGANPIKLGDLLKLQTGTLSSGLNADVQLFQLIQAFVQLANKNGAAAATLPVGILGIAGVTTTLGVIQPPQFSAIGDPRLAKLNPTGANQIYVQTGQVRALISVDLSLINTTLQLVKTALNAVVGSINTLLAPGCLLGGTCTQTDLQVLPNLSLDIGLEIGTGASRVTDYSCPANSVGSKSLSASTTTAAGALKIGRIDKAIWFSGSSAESVTPLTLVDIGSKVCHGSNCGPRTPFAGGGSELIVNIPLDQVTVQNMLFNNPPNVNSGQTLIQSVPRPTAQGTLTNSLNNPTLIVHSPTLSGGLLGGASEHSAIDPVSNPDHTDDSHYRPAQQPDHTIAEQPAAQPRYRCQQCECRCQPHLRPDRQGLSSDLAPTAIPHRTSRRRRRCARSSARPCFRRCHSSPTAPGRCRCPPAWW